MSNALNLITDPDIRQVRIESMTIFPRTINDNETGGHVSFTLPSKGYLSSDSRIIIPAKCVDPAYQYPPNVGIGALISTVSLSTESSGVIAQVDNFGELFATLQNLTPPEKKTNILVIDHSAHTRLIQDFSHIKVIMANINLNNVKVTKIQVQQV